MSADLGLADYEFYYGAAAGADGLDFGLNSNVDVMKIEGLTDQDALVADKQHHAQFGDIPGTYLAKSRVVVLDLDIRKGNLTDTQWRDLFDDVEGHFTIDKDDEQELHWQFPGEEERFLRARVLRRRRIIEPDSELGLGRITMQLRASDPRYYRAAPQSDNNNTGNFTVTNNGKQNAYPIINFERSGSPATCGITNNTTGQVISVTGLTGTTDLIMDMDSLIRGQSGLVVYRGSTNDYGNWQQTREPFYLAPGANDIDLDAGGNVDFQWWETYV